MADFMMIDNMSEARPGGFRSLWHNLMATFGLRRSPLGGFGGRLPTMEGSGG